MKSSRSKTIEVGQALHGYDRGHSLLATSEVFSRAAESTIFVLSDLSGPHLIPGFEEYITGYPLPDLSLYALAKTWYAPEMDRPGCVWTHTLLIRWADLAVVDDCSVLLEWFRRPSPSVIQRSAYSGKLMVETRSMSVTTSGPGISSLQIATNTLDAIYDSPNLPVFLPAASAASHQSLVLRLWSQQWPRLRRAFSFCTGSLESRRLDSRPFDLQVIPISTTSIARRELPSAVFIRASYSGSERDPATTAWLPIAAQDLQNPVPGLRSFLRRYGADVEGQRMGYTGLVKTWVAVQSCREGDLAFRDLVQNVLSLFPSNSDALKLKGTLLSPTTVEDHLELPVTLEQRLLTVATLPEDEKVPRSIFESDEWAGRLVSLDHERALRLAQALADSDCLNPIGDGFLTSIAANLQAWQLEGASSSIGLLIVARNPALARDPATWRLLAPRSHELLETLTSQDFSPEERRGMIRAILTSRVPSLAAPLTHLFGADVVCAALDWVDARGPGEDISVEWREQFSRNSETVSVWLENVNPATPCVLRVLTETLNPFDSPVLALRTSVWGPLLDTGAPKSIRSNTFLLVLGCQTAAHGGYELVSKVFENVHRATAFDSLGHESWLLLREVLPTLSRYKNWDICERLRRLLVFRFSDPAWPTQAFLEALRNPHTLQSTLQFLTSRKAPHGFAARLIRDLDQGHAILAPNQIEAVGNFRENLRRWW